MLRPLSPHWSIEIPPEFTFAETEDGFQVFERPGMKIFAVIYLDVPFDASAAILELMGPDQSEMFPFPIALRGAKGAGFHFRDERVGECFDTKVAAFGEALSVSFQFSEPDQLDTAMELWRSVRHSAPNWIWSCERLGPGRQKLAEALLSGRFVDEARDELERDGRVDEAMPVLLKALQEGTPDQRINASFLVELLGQAPELIVRELTNLRSHGDLRVRQSAERTLGQVLRIT